MKISVCIVTHRPQFTDWAMWNYERQSYADKELVLISGEGSIGAKRNEAVRKASGDLVTFFDDDDWAHPERLSRTVAALESSDVSVAGWDRGMFLHLQTRAISTHHCPGFILPCTATIQRSVMVQYPFEDTNMAEDTRQMQTMMPHVNRVVLVAQDYPCVWLVHDFNTMSKRQYNWRIAAEGELGRGWDKETQEQLYILQSKLSRPT